MCSSDLPSRFDAEPAQQPKRRAAVTGSGRETSSTERAGVYKLTPDRVAAMKESGAWFDPKRKAKMVEYYINYDKENKVRN